MNCSPTLYSVDLHTQPGDSATTFPARLGDLWLVALLPVTEAL